MNKIKIGIISTFYKNYNYGGKLQSYALVKAIEKEGYVAKQIQYSQHSYKTNKNNLLKKVKRLIIEMDYRHALFQKFLLKVNPCLKRKITIRKQAFDKFDEIIPHSQGVYSDDTLIETNQDFDVFITGSDQVWNPLLFKKGYFLPFVNENKCKFSYAASIANNIDGEYKNIYHDYLQSFDAISIREAFHKKILEEIVQKDIYVTVDPTILLTKNDWDDISSNKIIDEPYIFTYFLGYDKKSRNLAKKIAKEKNMKIVTLPHLLGTAGRAYLSDMKYGDTQLYDVSPADFISLIKHSSYVLTDSFHASVLSIIYKKSFVVFNRIGFKRMGSRIEQLLELYDLKARFCLSNESHFHVLDILNEKLSYDEDNKCLYSSIQLSKEFLFEHIRKAEADYEN